MPTRIVDGGGPQVSALGLAIGLILAGLIAGCSQKPEAPEGPGTRSPIEGAVFSTFDEFNDSVAARVTERITGKKDQMPDFRVVAVTAGAYVVGTLLRHDQFIPVTASACLPPQGDLELSSIPAPTMFPSYSISQSVAVNVGLDDAVFEGLGQAGFGLKQDKSISLSVAEATIELWSDLGLKAALSSASCRGALEAGKTYRLVRGRVRGTRSFSFGLNRTGQANLGLAKVGNFEAKIGGDGSTIRVTDAGPVAFVLVLSDVTVPAGGEKTVKVAAPSAAMATSAGGLVYIQQDATDGSSSGAKVKQLLQRKNLPVASAVEKVSTDKMPRTAEVRYFHPEDEPRAAAAAAELRQEYPSTKVVFFRIPAPKGQLEVWLPRRAL